MEEGTWNKNENQEIVGFIIDYHVTVEQKVKNILTVQIRENKRRCENKKTNICKLKKKKPKKNNER